MIDIKGPAHPSSKGEDMTDDRFIVGLSGYARSGKDSIADILVAHYGFKRFAFADKLRECVYALNPTVKGYRQRPVEEWEGLSDEYLFRTVYSDVQGVIDEYGWGSYKETEFGPAIRELLQRMGTEVGRDIIGENVWVDALDKMDGKIVVTDMRFPNEYTKVITGGGNTIRVSRPDIAAVNTHVSETALDHVRMGYDIWNNGTLEDLEKAVDKWASFVGLNKV